MDTRRLLTLSLVAAIAVATLSARADNGVDFRSSMEAVDAAIRRGAYAEALAAGQSLVSTAQNAPSNQANIGIAQERLGTIQRALGRDDEAESAYQASMTAFTSAYGETDERTLQAVDLLAEFYVAQGRSVDALSLVSDRLQRLEDTVGERHTTLKPMLGRVASLQRATGDTGASIATYKRLLVLQERDLPQHHPDLLASQQALAQMFRQRGEPDRAIPYFEQLVRYGEERLGPLHPGLAELQTLLADTLAEAGQNDDAERLYLEALKFQQRIQGENPDLLPLLKKIAAFYGRTGDRAKETEFQQRLDALTGAAATIRDEHGA